VARNLAGEGLLAAFLLAAVAWSSPGLLPWAAAGLAVWFVRRALHREASGLVGHVGIAQTALAPRGEVLLDGVRYEGEAAEPVQPGEPVRVVAEEPGLLRVAAVGARGADVWSRRGRRWRKL